MTDKPKNRSQGADLLIYALFILVLTLTGTGAWYIYKIDHRINKLTVIVGHIAQHYENISETEESKTNTKLSKDLSHQYGNDNFNDETDEISNSLVKLSNLIQNLQPKLDPDIAKLIAGSVSKYSIQYKLPPELLVHLIFRESSFNLMNNSSKDAKGLMQILPKAHMDKLKEYDINENSSLYYIDNNIMLGTIILLQYFEKHKSIKKALESYVGGEQQGYVSDILSGYVDTKINEVRMYNEASLQHKEISQEQMDTEPEPDSTDETGSE